LASIHLVRQRTEAAFDIAGLVAVKHGLVDVLTIAAGRGVLGLGENRIVTLATSIYLSSASNCN
jgi:hypothetical protein